MKSWVWTVCASGQPFSPICGRMWEYKRSIHKFVLDDGMAGTVGMARRVQDQIDEERLFPVWAERNDDGMQR